MSPIRRILTAAALAGLGIARAGAGELEGTWSGEHLGPQKDSAVTLTVAGESFTMKVVRNDGEVVTIQGTIKSDEKATPKTLDMTAVAAKHGERSAPLPNREGIYQVQGDVLTLRAATRRPAHLTGEKIEEDPGYLKLGRVKEETKAEEAKPATTDAAAPAVKPAEAEVKSPEAPKSEEPTATPKP